MIRIYDVAMCTVMRDAIQSTCVTSDFKRQGPTHYKLGCAQQLCVCMLVANYRARVCVCVWLGIIIVCRLSHLTNCIQFPTLNSE